MHPLRGTASFGSCFFSRTHSPPEKRYSAALSGNLEPADMQWEQSSGRPQDHHFHPFPVDNGIISPHLQSWWLTQWSPCTDWCAADCQAIQGSIIWSRVESTEWLWKCLAAWVSVKEREGEDQEHGSGKAQSRPKKKEVNQSLRIWSWKGSWVLSSPTFHKMFLRILVSQDA